MDVRGEQQQRLSNPSLERLLHLVRSLDTNCRAALYVVRTPQWLPARSDRRLGYSGPDPMEDAGQQEAAR